MVIGNAWCSSVSEGSIVAGQWVEGQLSIRKEQRTENNRLKKFCYRTLDTKIPIMTVSLTWLDANFAMLNESYVWITFSLYTQFYLYYWIHEWNLSIYWFPRNLLQPSILYTSETANREEYREQFRLLQQVGINQMHTYLPYWKDLNL